LKASFCCFYNSNTVSRLGTDARSYSQKEIFMITLSTTRTEPAWRAHAFKVILILLVLSVISPAAVCADDNSRAPDLGNCQRLHAPEGNKVAFHVYAEGVQIYRWNGTTWTFVAPEATLFADAGGNGVVGTHYVGPTWESNSGSKVRGLVLERCTADPTAIPWLLLRAVSPEGPGIFHQVTYIQRVNTVGGIAPTSPGNFSGEEARVPYTAEYFFYRAHD